MLMKKLLFKKKELAAKWKKGMVSTWFFEVL